MWTNKDLEQILSLYLFVYNSLLDIPSYSTRHSSSPRGSNEYSAFRKTINSYGSVPVYGGSYASVESTQSLQGQSTSSPLLQPRTSATINPYRVTSESKWLSLHNHDKPKRVIITIILLYYIIKEILTQTRRQLFIDTHKHKNGDNNSKKISIK